MTDVRKKLSVSEAFTAAGKQFWQRPLFCVAIFLLIILVGTVGGSLTNIIMGEGVSMLASTALLVGISGVCVLIIGELLKFGFKKVALRLVRGAEAGYGDLIVSIQQGVRYIAGLVLFNLVVWGVPLGIASVSFSVTDVSVLMLQNTLSGTLILGILLGLAAFLGLIFHLFPYLILDRNLGVFRSFADAWQLTHGAQFELVIFYAVAALLNLVGFLVFGVGLLVTLPITILAQAQAYQQLAKNTFEFESDNL